MDASNLLKPALASGRLRCVGSTTFQEFRQHFEKDRALARRFQRIEVGEPSVEDTVKILEGLRKQYEEFHGVRYADEALRAAAELGAKYLHDRKMPDKAIDLIDETGAAKKLGRNRDRDIDTDGFSRARGGGGATSSKVLARMAQIPPREVSSSDRERLQSMEAQLRAVVFGQDEAIGQLVSAIKLSRAGPAGAGEANRVVSSDRADRRRQDRGRKAAREGDGDRLPPLRHERVHGGAHGPRASSAPLRGMSASIRAVS